MQHPNFNISKNNHLYIRQLYFLTSRVLKTGDTNFRTINFFAKPDKQNEVISKLEELQKYTEITCFWIEKAYRNNTFLNLFVWLSMTYALRIYGTKYFLFGTCSRSLARLYGQTSKSIQIHRDRINNKSTFIFMAHRSTCVTGMLEIICHKLKRTLKSSERPMILRRLTNVVRGVIYSKAITQS